MKAGHWVLLRGLTREARHWGALPQALARLPGCERVTLLDLPGNGRLHELRSPTSVTLMLEAARAQLQQVAPGGPCHLLAMSLGGMVATQWAQRYPAELKGLVLINSSMRPFSHPAQRLRPRNWPMLIALAWHWQQPGYAEEAIHRMTCERLTTRAQDLAEWTRIRADAGVSAANAWRQLWAAARFSALAQPPTCATLILSSAKDRLVNPICSQQIARAWHAPHRQHPWAGHDLPHDDLEWTCQAVADWLAAH